MNRLLASFLLLVVVTSSTGCVQGYALDGKRDDYFRLFTGNAAAGVASSHSEVTRQPAAFIGGANAHAYAGPSVGQEDPGPVEAEGKFEQMKFWRPPLGGQWELCVRQNSLVMVGGEFSWSVKVTPRGAALPILELEKTNRDPDDNFCVRANVQRATNYKVTVNGKAFASTSSHISESATFKIRWTISILP